jgi:hypothetical protein
VSKQLVSHPRYGLCLQWVKEAQRIMRRRDCDWPGLPSGQVPLHCSGELNRLIEDGMACRISRPAKVNPAHVREFIMMTEAGEREWTKLVSTR